MKKELLDILACPQCKGPVSPYKQTEGIACLHCRLLFPIHDQIPIMLIDEARPLVDQDDEYSAAIESAP